MENDEREHLIKQCVELARAKRRWKIAFFGVFLGLSLCCLLALVIATVEYLQFEAHVRQQRVLAEQNAREAEKAVQLAYASREAAMARLSTDLRHEGPKEIIASDFPAFKAPASGDWPLFRGNSLQTGVAGSTLPEKLSVLWKVKTKDGIEGTAAIVGGTVYIGSLDEHLHAFELATGKEKWRYKAVPFKAPVSFKDGSVYIGDSDGIFHCVAAATGKQRWTFKTEGEIAGGANFSNDAVLFGSGDETLYCLTMEGKERWRFKVPGGPVLGTPAVVDGRTFAAGCDSTLHVIDLATGKEQGSVDLGGQIGATPAIVGDFMYIGTMTNQFLGINWKKPEIAWTYEAAKHQQPFYASAAVTDTLVIAGSRDKRVHALDRKTGKEVWSFDTRNKVDSSPVIVGQRIFVGSTDSNLYVLDLAKGTEIARFELGSPIAGSPAVGDRCLVIGTDDGTIYCLGEK
jgi:outer membrane protein assembly factor BamB